MSDIGIRFLLLPMFANYGFAMFAINVAKNGASSETGFFALSAASFVMVDSSCEARNARGVSPSRFLSRASIADCAMILLAIFVTMALPDSFVAIVCASFAALISARVGSSAVATALATSVVNSSVFFSAKNQGSLSLTTASGSAVGTVAGASSLCLIAAASASLSTAVAAVNSSSTFASAALSPPSSVFYLLTFSSSMFF